MASSSASTSGSSNHWSGQASYLYSRLYGNYSGLASADENGRVSPNVNRYYDNTIMSYGSDGKAVYGLLPTDRPHTFKLSGAYDFKWGTTVGANWFVESGVPQTTVVRFTGYPVFVYGRGDLGRTPVLSQLDLNLMQEFRLPGHSRDPAGGEHRQRVRPGYVDGLLPCEQLRPDAVRLGHGRLRQHQHCRMARAPVLYQPGGYNVNKIVADYIAGGGNLKANPFYKTPQSFEGRRQIRVQAKITF